MASFIQSFSGQALSWGLGTWMYSSDVPSRPLDQQGHGLQETLEAKQVEVLDYKDEVSLGHAVSKPLRGLTRLVYAQAVGCLVAPVGMAYNGIAWLKQRSISREVNTESTEKANAYWEAFSQDLTHFTSAAVGLAMLGLQAYFTSNDPEALPYFLAPSPLALYYAWNPVAISSFMVPGHLAPGMVSSIAFKSYYGLQKEGGGLLDFEAADVEQPSGGLIQSKWEQVCDEILHHYALAFFIAGEEATKLPSPPLAGTLARWLRRNGVSSEWIEGLRRLQREFKQLKGLRQTCLKAMPGHLHNPTVPDFPWNMAECRARVTERLKSLWEPKQNVQLASWQAFLEKQLLELPQVQGGSDLLQAFRVKFLAGSSPMDLLASAGQGGAAAVRRSYRRLVLALHPDRCPNQDPESPEYREHQILFQTLQEAYAIVRSEA